MFGREIFRKSSMEKMTSPENLDELLQVNSVKTWLLLAAVAVVLSGMLLWAFLGSISQEVKGFGIVRIQELPRVVVSDGSGQIDSVLCKTGDRIIKGQRLMTVLFLEGSARHDIISPFVGTVTGLNVKEGTFVETGAEVVEIVRNQETINVQPEVIFFVEGAEVPKLKAGMKASLLLGKPGIPGKYLTGSISFIAAYPVSPGTFKKYFPDEDISSRLKGKEVKDIYEIRASIIPEFSTLSDVDRTLILPLNGLSCRVSVVVSKNSPISYLLN